MLALFVKPSVIHRNELVYTAAPLLNSIMPSHLGPVCTLVVAGCEEKVNKVKTQNCHKLKQIVT